AEALVEARYEEREREARQRLDDRLLAQAKTLAGRVRPRYRWERQNNYYLHSAGTAALTASLAQPQMRLSCLINFAQADHLFAPVTPKNPPKNRRNWGFVAPTPLQSQIWHRYLMDLDLEESIEQPDSGWPRIYSRIETNGWSAVPLFPAQERLGL